MHLGERYEMVADGHAWWYKHFAPKAKDLEVAEGEARKERRGPWHDKAPVPPWEYRKTNKSKSNGNRSS